MAIDVLYGHLGVPSGDVALLARTLGEVGVPEIIRATLVDEVRSERYNISDLYAELSALQAETLRLDTTVRSRAFEAVSALFQHCLDETAQIQELVIETSGHGYAEISESGVVMSFNIALARILGQSELSGGCLFDWFPSAGGQLKDELETLVHEGEGVRRFGRLRLKAGPGNAAPAYVTAELGIVKTGRQARFFVIVTDISQLVAAEERAYREAEFGVVRYSRNLDVTFCNDAAARILDRPLVELHGMNVEDLVASEDLNVARDQASRREKGEASRYPVRMRTPHGIRRVEVTAMPQFDDDGGQRTSTLTFIRLIEPFLLRDKLRESIDQTGVAHEMVRFTHETIKELVPHDRLVLLFYDESGRWAWPAHVEPPPTKPWTTRWFPVSDTMKMHLMEAEKRDRFGNLTIPDLDAWLTGLPEGEELRANSMVQGLLKTGVRSLIVTSAIINDRLIASLALLRDARSSLRLTGFDDRESGYLKDMQIDYFVHSLSNWFEIKEWDFLNALARKLPKELRGADHFTVSLPPDRDRRVGRLLTTWLCQFHRWRSASLYEVDHADNVFRLLASTTSKRARIKTTKCYSSLWRTAFWEERSGARRTRSSAALGTDRPRTKHSSLATAGRSRRWPCQ